MITITALFHPARHGTRRPVALHSRWFGRWWCRHVKARQIFENAIEIADLHRTLLHHGRHGSGELIDLTRYDVIVAKSPIDPPGGNLRARRSDCLRYENVPIGWHPPLAPPAIDK